MLKTVFAVIVVRIFFLTSNTLFCCGLPSLKEKMNTDRTNILCMANRTKNNYIPHVYYINLDKSTDRRSIIELKLKMFGYKYSRIQAITPNDFRKPNGNITNNRLLLQSVTLSHLEAIYTVINEKQNTVGYALIIEDDARFLFDIINWKELISSAPSSDWTILQVTNSNHHVSRYYYENVYKVTKKIWERRTCNKYWSTVSYIINTAKLNNSTLRNIFGNPTMDEKLNFNIRFDNTKLFINRCNITDLSMSGKLRCKGKIAIEADKFIYNLGTPHVYVSNIPFITFAENASSTISIGHGDLSTQSSRNLYLIASDAVKMGGLPSYISSILCF